MAQKSHVLHGRDHNPGGADPIPGLDTKLPTIKGVYSFGTAPPDAVDPNNFVIGSLDSGDDANWFYVYDLPHKLLYLQDNLISSPATDDGSSPLWLVSIAANLGGMAGQGMIEPVPPGVHAQADQIDVRKDIGGSVFLQRTYVTGGPPPRKLHVVYEGGPAAPVNCSLSVSLIHPGPVFETGEA